ncbi:MAG: ABC transporter ATP-binding protein, partial [Desulfovibrionaceae bacterium]
MDQPLLQLRDVRKRYSVSTGFGLGEPTVVTAVNRVSLDLCAGETLGLVGESGCGKSTLARLILGLERPTAGEIFYHGKPVDQWRRKDLRRRMQMIFQDPFSSLNPRQRIGAIVGEGPAIHRMGSRRERKEAVLKLLALVGLSPEHARRYPHEFSGGQRQRVAIARALALEPELVVCDEPVSALDVSIQAQVLELLADMRRRFQLTYLFISHDLSVVGHVCERAAVMYLGSLVELGPTEALFAEPLHPYTKALLAAVPVPDPDAARGRAELSGDPPSPIDPPEGCPFHPRCEQSMEVCRDNSPELREVEPGRFAACWLYA